MDDNIHIVEYNSNWPAMAEKEISMLKKVFKNCHWIVDIQHIGSTAIPGLAAKPIIDIYIGATSIQDAQQSIPAIEQLGYQFWLDNPNKEKMFFVKGMPPFGACRTHHIHIVKYDSSYWRAQILFRDYMRIHPEEAQVYAALKKNLAQQHAEDRESYTNAKSEYIDFVLHKAGFKEHPTSANLRGWSSWKG